MEYTQSVNESLGHTIAKAFPYVDKKGRQIGAQVTTWEADYVALADQTRRGSMIEPGHYFIMCPSATRAGDCYGAGQRPQLFKTESERAQAIVRYFAGAAKRASKIEGADYERALGGAQ